MKPGGVTWTRIPEGERNEEAAIHLGCILRVWGRDGDYSCRVNDDFLGWTYETIEEAKVAAIRDATEYAMARKES